MDYNSAEHNLNTTLIVSLRHLSSQTQIDFFFANGIAKLLFESLMMSEWYCSQEHHFFGLGRLYKMNLGADSTLNS